MLSMTERDYAWSTTKDFSSFGSNRMEAVKITRQPKRNDQKVKYPWTISITVGTSANGKFQPEKSAKKFLSDDEIQKFFGDIAAYISVWEMTFGAPFIRNVIEPYKAKRPGRPAYQSPELKMGSLAAASMLQPLLTTTALTMIRFD